MAEVVRADVSGRRADGFAVQRVVLDGGHILRYGRETMQTENKRITCSMLCSALQSCRQFDDLLSLRYRKEPVNAEDTNYYEEYVTVTFISGGSREICVTGDSCWGMVKDIVNHIDG